MEEEVKIPFSLTMDEKSLIEVREAIENIFKKLKSYETERSTSRKRYIVPGLADNETQVESIMRSIKALQAQYAILEKSSPFDTIREKEAEIAQYVQDIAKAQATINHEKATYASYSKKVKADEKMLADIKSKEVELQEEYNQKVQEVGTGKGTKARLAELKKEYEAQKAILDERYRKAGTDKTIDTYTRDNSKAEYEAAKANKAEYETAIQRLNEEIAKESEILQQEGAEQAFLEQKNQELARMNAQLKEYQTTLEQVVTASADLVGTDKFMTGYKTDAEKEQDKLQAEKLKAEQAMEAEYQKILRETERERSQSVKRMLNEEKEADRLSAQIKAQAEKEKQDAIKASERAEKARQAEIRKEISAVKESAAQYYYRLRATKMLAYTFKSMYSNMDKFGKKSVETSKKALSAYMRLIPGVNALRRALSKTQDTQKKLSREMRSSTKSHDKFNISLKKALTTILKYGFGIRSLYILLRKLRSAIKDGLGEMSQQFEDVNARMSSMLTSVNYMKASITTIAEPLLTLLAPALERISEIVANISYHIASFIAALSGQQTVYKAIKVQADYAESLDKTAKNAKKAKKELAGFDELNVLHSNDDDENEYTMGWEIVPTLTEAFPIIDKIKDILSTLFDPIKKAWEKMKDFLIDSWKYMVEKLKSLAGTIWDDFLKVWTDGRVQKIFENILKIVGDIFLIIGNIAEAIEEAWKHNNNGYRILSAIVDIIGIIVEGLKDCADYTVEWSKKLSLIPLFDAIADVMETQVVPAVQKVVDLFKYLYKYVFLEIVRYVVEELAPILIRAFGNIIETIGNIAERLRIALEENDRGKRIVAQLEKLFTIVGDKILEVSEKTKEWSKNLDFSKLLDSTIKLLEDIEPLVQFIADTVGKFWTDVLLPFWQYLIETGGPMLLDTLDKIVSNIKDWDVLNENVDKLFAAMEKFLELGWETLLQILEDLGMAITDFLQSDELSKIVDVFSKWIDEADPKELAKAIEYLVVSFLALKAAIGLFANVIAPLFVVWRTFVNAAKQKAMISAVKELTKALGAGGTAGAGGASAAGSGGLIGSLGTLGLVLADIAGAIAVVAAGFEAFRLGGIHKLKTDLPETASATNGVTKELNGFEKILKKIYEVFHPGETLADHIVVPSDYEKLETMKDKLIDMSQQMENAGTLSTETGNKITEALDIWLSHDERMEDLSEEEVKHFSELYDAVEKYYTKVSDSQSAEDAISRLSADWEKIPESVPTRDAGNLDGKEYADGVIDGVSTADWEKVSDYELIKGLIPDGNAALIEGQEYADGIINGIETADWEKILETLPDESDGTESGEALANGVTTAVNSALQNSSADMEENGRFLVQGLDKGVTEELEQTDTMSWWQKILQSLKDFFTIGSPSVVMQEQGTYIMQGLLLGIDTMIPVVVEALTNFGISVMTSLTSVWTSMSTSIQTAWTNFANMISTSITNIITTVKSKLNSNTLATTGRDLINGLKNSAETAWNNFKATLSSGMQNLIDEFKRNFNSSTLLDAGRSLIDGLKQGLISSLNSVLDTVKSICEQIVSTAKKAFSIHSPSKVFMNIGENLMYGMAEGVNEEKSEVTDAFNDLVPEDKFADRFVSSLSGMKNKAIDVITDMVNSMEDTMDNLDLISSIDAMYARMNKLDSIKVPNIAMGKVLPSNIQFRATTAQFDPAQMAEAVKSAMIESMDDMRYNNSDNGDIVLQIDGYEIFRAVRNQNDIFRTSTGYGAL